MFPTCAYLGALCPAGGVTASRPGLWNPSPVTSYSGLPGMTLPLPYPINSELRTEQFAPCEWCCK